MAKKNVAREVLWPDSKKILIRAAFLYVGQGASAIVFCRDGDTYRVVVVDINLDRKLRGVDVPALVKDLLDGASLDAFANTHPHDDHLCGTKALSDAVDIKAVWHANHKPSKKYGNKHGELTALIKKVTDKYGKDAEVVIERKDGAQDYGEAQYDFIHPTEHLTEDVNEEDADKRRARIHEQCGIIKFGKGEKWIIFVGDADRCAFEQHVNKDLSDERVKSVGLGASHHGSDTFFRENEEQDAYMKGLDSVDPSYVFVSAPTTEESPHDHPCEFAMEKYEEKVGEDHVYHTGEDRYCFILDLYDDGTHADPRPDDGKLVETYGLEEEEDDGGGSDKSKASASTGPFIPPREQAGQYQPRKYG